jgi:hypothetical protein
MATNDDWFAEPEIEPTLNELYTRRLVAWGYITPRGETLWDKKPIFSLLYQEYARGVQEFLNYPLAFTWGFRKDWKTDPTRPASEDPQPNVKMVLSTDA